MRQVTSVVGQEGRELSEFLLVAEHQAPARFEADNARTGDPRAPRGEAVGSAADREQL